MQRWLQRLGWWCQSCRRDLNLGQAEPENLYFWWACASEADVFGCTFSCVSCLSRNMGAVQGNHDDHFAGGSLLLLGPNVKCARNSLLPFLESHFLKVTFSKSLSQCTSERQILQVAMLSVFCMGLSVLVYVLCVSALSSSSVLLFMMVKEIGLCMFYALNFTDALTPLHAHPNIHKCKYAHKRENMCHHISPNAVHFSNTFEFCGWYATFILNWSLSCAHNILNLLSLLRSRHLIWCFSCGQSILNSVFLLR